MNTVNNTHNDYLKETTLDEITPIQNNEPEIYRKRKHSQWFMFGQKFPRSEIVFFTQMIIIGFVISVSVYNLSVECGDSSLWITLLSSCLGYVLPNPSLQRNVIVT